MSRRSRSSIFAIAASITRNVTGNPAPELAPGLLWVDVLNRSRADGQARGRAEPTRIHGEMP